MTYQKARFIENGNGHPLLWEKEVWVHAERPHIEVGQDFFSKHISCALSFVTPVTDMNGLEMVLEADCVELLPEFQEDVPVIPFAEWCRENGIEEEQL